MKSRIQFVSGIVIAAMLTGFVMAKDKEVAKVDAAAPKAKTFKGALAAKPADAAANVLAVLTVKAKEKDGKDTTFNVLATDEAVIAKIKELVEKGGEVTIKGVASEDGKSITASAADAAKAKAAAGDKKTEKPAKE